MKVIFSAALVLAAASFLFSQETRGTISGSVTDATGAAIAKAKITVTGKETGVQTSATSEASGAYNIPFLPLGEYQISAEAPGFKKYVRPGIALSTGAHPVIDIHMEVGAVTESVEVHAE